MRVPQGKGSRLIVCHAGSSNTGFVPECKLIFRSRRQNINTDYHSEMNARTFKDWFSNKLLCSLEEGSIIIIDNASYHSVVENKIPNMSSKKKNIMDWLQLNNIPFKPTDTIRELLELIAPFKKQQKQHELDRIANEMGHEVIRPLSV